MKNKRNFIGIIGFFLVMVVLSLTGCADPVGPGTGNTTTGTSTINTGGGNVPKTASRIYFIKMGTMTEASGTLCFLPEGTSTGYMFPNRTMTGYSVTKDHSTIVFAEVLSGYSGTYLAFMKPDGTSYRQTHIRGSNPSFNSDGDVVYFDDGGTIYSMNTDGSNKQEIEIPGVYGTKRFPRISPDGKKLAFCQPSAGAKWYSDEVVYVYVYDFGTGQVTKLNNDSIPASYLSWSPDGATIAFSTTTGITPPVCELWTVKANGSAQPERIADSGSPAWGACGFPGYTDDGSILCGSTRNKQLNWRSDWDGSHYKYELAKIKPNGTSMTILLPGYSIKDPVWVATP